MNIVLGSSQSLIEGSSWTAESTSAAQQHDDNNMEMIDRSAGEWNKTWQGCKTLRSFFATVISTARSRARPGCPGQPTYDQVTLSLCPSNTRSSVPWDRSRAQRDSSQVSNRYAVRVLNVAQNQHLNMTTDTVESHSGIRTASLSGGSTPATDRNVSSVTPSGSCMIGQTTRITDLFIRITK